MKISIGKAAQELGVTNETLRRWEKTGKIVVEKTLSGHRRYDLAKLHGYSPRKKSDEKRTLAYARVSSHDQKEDLKRQAAVLESYCASQGWTFEILQDLGSGLNYSKKGLKKLIQEICSGNVQRLVITHKDRLLRFGAELIFPAFTSIIGRVKFCRRYGLSVHGSAALCIGRRYLGNSERLPRRLDQIPDGKSGHVALSLPARNRDEHVWTSWRKLHKRLPVVLAAHFRAQYSDPLDPKNRVLSDTEEVLDIVGEIPAHEPTAELLGCRI